MSDKLSKVIALVELAARDTTPMPERLAAALRAVVIIHKHQLVISAPGAPSVEGARDDAEDVWGSVDEEMARTLEEIAHAFDPPLSRVVNPAEFFSERYRR